MSVKRVLVTDDVDPILLSQLKELGFEVDFRPKIKLEEVHAIVDLYYGMVINSKIIAKAELLGKAKQLKFIARLGSGMEIIDQDFAREKGIHVMSAPEGNRNAVAEHAMGFLLAMANNLYRSTNEVKSFIWKREENRGFEILGKTIGLLGFGHTASTFARKLGSFGVEVLAYDKYKTNYAIEIPHVKESSLAEIFEKADVLSVHLPWTEETHHMINGVFLDQFQKPIYLINTARGKNVKMDDLVERLKEGKVKGACLDVFENEPPNADNKAFRELFEMENVLLSPHVAGWTIESKKRLSEVLLKQIKKLIELQQI